MTKEKESVLAEQRSQNLLLTNLKAIQVHHEGGALPQHLYVKVPVQSVGEIWSLLLPKCQ